MLSTSRIKRGLKSPKLIARYLNRLYHTRMGKYEYNREGTDIFEEEWDNLIILDACRYELVAEKISQGRLEKRISRGASTIEFLRGNFKDRELLDTVYVTGNPHLTKFGEELNVDLCEVIDVWGGGGWSSIFSTVMPKSVEKAGLDAAKDNPQKRMIIHFMQPHYPFIYDCEPEIEPGVSNIWQKVSRGELDISEEQAWRGYTKTFDKVWSSVQSLVDSLEGKTVVTADHGNIYNEKISPIPIRDWGHPVGIYDEKLVEVPWLVFDDDRKEISKGTAKSSQQVNENEIKDKLSKLGYT